MRRRWRLLVSRISWKKRNIPLCSIRNCFKDPMGIYLGKLKSHVIIQDTLHDSTASLSEILTTAESLQLQFNELSCNHSPELKSRHVHHPWQAFVRAFVFGTFDFGLNFSYRIQAKLLSFAFLPSSLPSAFKIVFARSPLCRLGSQLLSTTWQSSCIDLFSPFTLIGE